MRNISKGRVFIQTVTIHIICTPNLLWFYMLLQSHWKWQYYALWFETKTITRVFMTAMCYNKENSQINICVLYSKNSRLGSVSQPVYYNICLQHFSHNFILLKLKIQNTNIKVPRFSELPQPLQKWSLLQTTTLSPYHYCHCASAGMIGPQGSLNGPGMLNYLEG